MTIVVSDTSVLIDLVDADIVDEFFSLEMDVRTNTLVIGELDEEYRPEIDETLLTIDIPGEAMMQRIGASRVSLPALSLADTAALLQAQDLGAMLLTGDKALRRCAESLVEVHGSLWIFAKLVEDGILSKKNAARRLKRLVALNPRLPREEVEKLLQEWR
jgi:predicted nucleic acid-binding protein